MRMSVWLCDQEGLPLFLNKTSSNPPLHIRNTDVIPT